jgi:pimeloyl-ACP methyl ester carboxylesterase
VGRAALAHGQLLSAEAGQLAQRRENERRAFMTEHHGARRRTVQANDVEFVVLEAGTGPLALCLHGFPDAAHTWRHLLPELAAAGYHAVAPFMRGYAPTAVPRDGNYSIGALVADTVALHEVMGGDDQAVLIGSDWGAETAYGAAAFAPGRWRRLVTLAVPPFALDPVLFSDYRQLRRFFYLFFFRDPAAQAEAVVTADEMAFIDQLWRDWSPGYDAAGHLAEVKDCLRDPANLRAAIGYYRAPTGPSGTGGAGRYAAEDRAVLLPAEQPTLYLHGSADGCIGVELVATAQRHLPAGSRMMIVPDAGHFLHLERPGEVNWLILDWIAR